MNNSNTALNNINRLFNCVNNSLYRTTGKLSYERLQDAIIRLCEAVNALPETVETEFMWGTIGEGGEANLGDLITGAFWHSIDWQSSNDEKSCHLNTALGSIYSAGMGCLDDDENTGENFTHRRLDFLARGGDPSIAI